MKIRVGKCEECPFYQYEFNEGSIGNEDLHICGLKAFQMYGKYSLSKTGNYLLDIKKNGTVKHPSWCPLLKDDVTIKFRA